jgi:hypothetical protein
MNQLMRVIPTVPSYWEAIRDERVRKAEAESEIELRQLIEEQKVLEAEAGRVAAEIDRCGESESSVRAHCTLAHWWGSLFLLASALAVVSAWWSVNWYLTLTWEKAVLAATLSVLPLIGWMGFLMRARDSMQARTVQKIICALALVVVLSSVAAGALLGIGRMAGTSLAEERAASSPSGSADLDAPVVAPQTSRAIWVTKLLALFTAGAVVLLIVASEAAAGIAFDEYVKRMTVVRTVAPLHRRRDELEELLASNAWAQEAARQRPELLRAELTIAGLTQEQAALEKAAADARAAAETERQAQEWARERDSLGFLIRRVAIAFAIGLALILLAVAVTIADEAPRDATVVLLDLSRSTGPGEFAKNLRGVEGVIVRMPPGGHLTVLPITAASFAEAPLFRESAPSVAGRFGEHLEIWQTAARARWRRVADKLAPTAAGSDIFGALARAVEELPGGARPKRLILLSDMRHVGRGFNLERPFDASALLARRAEEQALVPKLNSVVVWALGVHTAGTDERSWGRLREFWTEYFRRAGAQLEAFTPNRTLPER